MPHSRRVPDSADTRIGGQGGHTETGGQSQDRSTGSATCGETTPGGPVTSAALGNGSGPLTPNGVYLCTVSVYRIHLRCSHSVRNRRSARSPNPAAQLRRGKMETRLTVFSFSHCVRNRERYRRLINSPCGAPRKRLQTRPGPICSLLLHGALQRVTRRRQSPRLRTSASHHSHVSAKVLS